MGDRELLEFAAKAAGIEVAWHSSKQPVRIEAGGPFGKVVAGFWNPLTDDGDALRLAVALDVIFQVARGMTTIACVGSFNVSVFENHADSDACAATRRAIVRAAAEIGKAISPSSPSAPDGGKG